MVDWKPRICCPVSRRQTPEWSIESQESRRQTPEWSIGSQEFVASIKKTNSRMVDWKSRTVALSPNLGCSSVILLHYFWKPRTVSGRLWLQEACVRSPLQTGQCHCSNPESMLALVRWAALTKVLETPGNTTPEDVTAVFGPVPFSYSPRVLNAAISMSLTPLTWWQNVCRHMCLVITTGHP